VPKSSRVGLPLPACLPVSHSSLQLIQTLAYARSAPCLPCSCSYFTIATFMDDHIAFHAKHLLGSS